MEEHQETLLGRPDGMVDLDRKLYKCVLKGESKLISKFDLQAPPKSAPRKDTILHFAVKVGRLDCIKQILEKCPLLIPCQNSKGDTALHIAARNGQDDIVYLLINPPKQQIRSSSTTNPDDDIELGGGDIEYNEAATDDHVKYSSTITRVENDKKDTALHEAVRNHRCFNGKRKDNYLKVLRLLTEAERSFECFPNNAGETPLYLAAGEGLYDFVDQILEACPSSAYDGPYGRTALHATLFHGNEGIGEILLQKMSKDKIGDMIRTADNDGRTPLHFAALRGCTDIYRKLLQKDKSVAYKPDKRGVLPVHLAAQIDNDTTMFFIFFEHCPDCYELVDHKGWNVLHFAASGDSTDTVLHRVLIGGGGGCDNNIKLLKGMVNEADNEGNTPLHVAVKCQNIFAVDVLLRSEIWHCRQIGYEQPLLHSTRPHRNGY